MESMTKHELLDRHRQAMMSDCLMSVSQKVLEV